MKKKSKDRLKNNNWEATECVTTKIYKPGELPWKHEKHIGCAHFLKFINENEFVLFIIRRAKTIEQYKFRRVEKVQ